MTPAELSGDAPPDKTRRFPAGGHPDFSSLLPAGFKDTDIDKITFTFVKNSDRPAVITRRLSTGIVSAVRPVHV